MVNDSEWINLGITRATCGYGWQNLDAALHSWVLAASEELTCGKGPNEAREKNPRVRTHHSHTHAEDVFQEDYRVVSGITQIRQAVDSSWPLT